MIDRIVYPAVKPWLGIALGGALYAALRTAPIPPAAAPWNTPALSCVHALVFALLVGLAWEALRARAFRRELLALSQPAPPTPVVMARDPWPYALLGWALHDSPDLRRTAEDFNGALERARRAAARSYEKRWWGYFAVAGAVPLVGLFESWQVLKAGLPPADSYFPLLVSWVEASAAVGIAALLQRRVDATFDLWTEIMGRRHLERHPIVERWIRSTRLGESQPDVAAATARPGAAIPAYRPEPSGGPNPAAGTGPAPLRTPATVAAPIPAPAAALPEWPAGAAQPSQTAAGPPPSTGAPPPAGADIGIDLTQWGTQLLQQSQLSRGGQNDEGGS